MSINHLLIIIFTVVVTALAQVLLKVGANDKLSNQQLTGVNVESLSLFFSVFLNKYVFAGMVLYIFSATLWIWVLSKVDISLAYPFVSLSFLITLGFGVMLFNEPLTNMKIIGTTLIILGCFVITRS